ncbi:MAG TPA: folate-binding protein [Advenella sp.]|nr:folate-binding protein [Advenella sp.]
MSTAPTGFTPDTPLHVTPLPDYRILTVRGAEAQTFLQGQFTQDVMAATATSARLSAYCTAKGRMLASFIFWQPAQPQASQETAYQLMVRSDIAESFAKRLRMFILRAKVTVEDTNMTPYAYWAGDNKIADTSLAHCEPWQITATESLMQLGLPGITGLQRGILISDAAIDTSQAQSGRPEQWAALDILAGLPWVEKANQEMFIPQDLNLDAIGAVSFTKGCYPGQEIVARSHYRGKLKRRMLNGVCDNPSAATVTPGTDITDSTNTREPSGQIVNAATLDETLYLLFEVRLEAAEHNRLVLGDENGPPITLLTIPYSLDKPALA